LADFATTPQVYVPYPEDPPPPTSKPKRRGWWGWIPWFGGRGHTQDVLAGIAGSGDGNGSKQYIGGEGGTDKPTCKNCTVHLGFLTAWTHTRPSLLPHLARLATVVPDYEIHLIGHSLGGAIAALAGLELRARGVECVVTTFGEPRVGNKGLVGYLDEVFGVGEWQGKKGEEREGREGGGFRRVTHVGDPVPLLPLGEWGYAMHGGEIYVSKPSLPFEITDMERCVGDNDEKCIAGADGGILDWKTVAAVADTVNEGGHDGGDDEVVREKWGLASRFRIWQLLFAHRDYFWRIGLCVPGGDPRGWGRGWYEKEREKGGRGDEL
jgi:pimeloyl-ACP methyl ester carboxylesterase